MSILFWSSQAWSILFLEQHPFLDRVHTASMVYPSVSIGSALVFFFGLSMALVMVRSFLFKVVCIALFQRHKLINNNINHIHISRVLNQKSSTHFKIHIKNPTNYHNQNYYLDVG